jgi:hypothetical protein
VQFEIHIDESQLFHMDNLLDIQNQ